MQIWFVAVTHQSNAQKGKSGVTIDVLKEPDTTQRRCLTNNRNLEGDWKIKLSSVTKLTCTNNMKPTVFPPDLTQAQLQT